FSSVVHAGLCDTMVILRFDDLGTTALYTLSLHDALPISARHRAGGRHRLGLPGRHPGAAGAAGLHGGPLAAAGARGAGHLPAARDRKSTRLNSSHVKISYAVFCLKKKKTKKP